MPSVERSLTIDAPPAKVYEAFVDLSRWLEWNPQLREVTPLSEGPLAPGFRARRLNPRRVAKRRLNPKPKRKTNRWLAKPADAFVY